MENIAMELDQSGDLENLLKMDLQEGIKDFTKFVGEWVS